MFESGGYVDRLSFFGVHHTVVSESQLAIMGGTGKYVNARGFATIKTFPAPNQPETDGLETVIQFTVYLCLTSLSVLFWNTLESVYNNMEKNICACLNFHEFEWEIGPRPPCAVLEGILIRIAL